LYFINNKVLEKQWYRMIELVAAVQWKKLYWGQVMRNEETRSGYRDNARNNARVLSRRIQTKPMKTGWLIEWANRCPVW